MEDKARISIITATCNAAEHLPGLIESLRNQTDQDFEWVVADGASSDGTLSQLQAIHDLKVSISSVPDFGIYDALNRGIDRATGDYYVIAGADDVFCKDAIANYRAAIAQSHADIIAASSRYGSKRLRVKQGPAWLWGQASYIAGHTLATAFKKNLHQSFGKYSRKYPIAADHLFVMSACQNGARVYTADFVAGAMGEEGVSSADRIGGATEVFRVQLALGGSLLVQLLLLFLRIIRIRMLSRHSTSRPNKTPEDSTAP
jgi:glycosyltransferase involved in cell wall biosynthesis